MTKELLKKQMLDTMKNRHSIRMYDIDKKISREDMEYILEVARLSPSSVGLEPWRFIVLNNADMRAKIRDLSWGAHPQLDTASDFILLIAKKGARYDSEVFCQHMDRRGLTGDKKDRALAIYKKFQEEDMEIANSPRALFDWAAKQTYIPMANMMTAATMIGIDSCPIEGFNYKKVDDYLDSEGIIDSKKEGIAVMVSFGYRAKEPKYAKERRSYEEVVTWVE